jgi:F-type H+-transporting ATPase subunit delta
MSERVETYAKALVQIARVENRLADVEDELFRFVRAVEGNDDLRMTLTDINIPVEQRVGVVDQLLEGKALAVTKAIVTLIVVAEHSGDLSEIVNAFIAEAAHTRSKETAEIRSAVELDDKTITKLTDALSKVTGKSLDVKVIVDESVLGGIVATVGDEVIDGSVRTRLNKLKETIDG